ncbi:MAG: hypothetical protein QI223_05900 [Candidatus Korarchaeota archaeon]|nr:hypothetical protein [Candidatus Korarchaeota archaeon]
MSPEPALSEVPPGDPTSAAADALAELASRWNCRSAGGRTTGGRGGPRPCRPAEDQIARKGYAAFYTREPIAYLLAFLAIFSPGDGWPPENPDGGLGVCDFACGEGVLLVASHAALETLSRLASEGPARGGEAHPNRGGDRGRPGGCLWGLDASADALRAASEFLTTRRKGSDTRVVLRHLPVDESGSLGSLDLWWGSPEGRDLPSAEVRVPRFDLVIMNPPFSRTTAPGRRGSRPRIFDYATTPQGFRRLWSEYTRLVRDIEAAAMEREGVKRIYGALVGEGRPFTRASVDPLRAGAALPFFFLADRYLRPGGRVALVLPRAALEGAAYLLMRAALVSGYHVECVVVPRDGESLSQSTQLSEVLVVARKMGGGAEGAPPPPTAVVILRRQPESPLEGALLAVEVARLVGEGSQGIARAGRSEAEVLFVRRGLVEEFVWNLSPVLGLPSRVERLVVRMTGGRLPGLRTRLTRLADAPGLRVTNPRRFRGREFSSRFVHSPSGGLRIVDRAGRESFSRLELDPSLARRISPRSADAERFYREKGGRLLVPEAVRFDSTPLVATWSPEPMASTRAHMVRLDPARERALCAWMNSTFAVAWLRAMFTTVEGRFGHVYGWHLRAMRVPDLTEPEVVRCLDSVFRRHARATWPPLPVQYREAMEGGESPRLDFDLDVLSALAEASGAHLDEDETRTELASLYAEILELL